MDKLIINKVSELSKVRHLVREDQFSDWLLENFNIRYDIPDSIKAANGEITDIDITEHSLTLAANGFTQIVKHVPGMLMSACYSGDAEFIAETLEFESVTGTKFQLYSLNQYKGRKYLYPSETIDYRGPDTVILLFDALANGLLKDPIKSIEVLTDNLKVDSISDNLNRYSLSESPIGIRNVIDLAAQGHYDAASYLYNVAEESDIFEPTLTDIVDNLNHLDEQYVEDLYKRAHHYNNLDLKEHISIHYPWLTMTSLPARPQLTLDNIPFEMSLKELSELIKSTNERSTN